VAVEIPVEGLRVGAVSGEGVHAVESAVERVVIPRAEVVLLGVNVELLTCVEQILRSIPGDNGKDVAKRVR
jgi:hypothetical protein